MRRRRITRLKHWMALRLAPWLKREDGWIATKGGLVYVMTYEQWTSLDWRSVNGHLVRAGVHPPLREKA